MDFGGLLRYPYFISVLPVSLCGARLDFLCLSWDPGVWDIKGVELWGTSCDPLKLWRKESSGLGLENLRNFEIF